MLISVASGKGGTGKTFISTNLAWAIGNNVQLMDCDVEEPNAHLFLNLKIKETEKVIAPVPRIDQDKCTYCGKCMDICRFHAIAVVDKSVVTFPELCHSCGGCVLVCPENAITEQERIVGIIEKGVIFPKQFDNIQGNNNEDKNQIDIEFIRGLMNIGQVMAPLIIKQVRNYVDSSKINIIDAPPGTSCPVIAAMKRVDFVVLVTEPTPFGLHDLILAVEAIKLLDIPHGLIINRAGVGNNDVKNYAQKENIPILMEIPFDKKIAEIYSRSELVVSCLPEYKKKFLKLYEQIMKLIGQERGRQIK